MTPLLVALAGGLGAGARFVVDGLITEHGRRSLPVATLLINVLGSMLLGVLAGWLGTGDLAARAILGVGLLGGFTTFSTASVELVRLLRAERPWAAVLLALMMLVLSLAAAILGLAVGRMMS